MMVEITGLAERAGMIGFAMFTRGHIHDKTIPVTIQSWGALEFFREILKYPADVAALFELWAVSRERGDTGADTLLGMQQDCTSMITNGLRVILGKTQVKMNFENYIKALVEGKNVGLVGWPDSVEFKCMSKQSKVGPLRDALKCGTVRWKVLTAAEKTRLVDQFRDMVKTGEVQEKAGKAKAPRKGANHASRSKKTLREDSSDEEKEDDEAPCTQSKAVPKALSRTLRSKRSAREESGEEDEEEDHPQAKSRATARTSGRISRVRPKKTPQRDDAGDDNTAPTKHKALSSAAWLKRDSPCKPLSEMTVEEKRARLVGLVTKAKKARKEGGEKESGCGKASSKRRRDEDGAKESRKRPRRKENPEEEEEHRGGKKLKRGAADKEEDVGDGWRVKGKRLRRGGEEEVEEGGHRRKKTTSHEDEAAKKNKAATTPALAMPRPKPRMKLPVGKGATASPTTGASATTPPAGAPAASASSAINNDAAAAATSSAANGNAPTPEAPVTSPAGTRSSPPTGAPSTGDPPAAKGPKPAKPNTVKGRAGGPPGVRV
ncbi:hypothetical protein DFH09DRAFT_1301325 [Mycena vulgaris]|nr:hypothetical protein DFH09DRAFT_1301325 [Mycena vulgaris]